MKKIYLILFVAFALTSCGVSEDKIEAAIDSTTVICTDTTVTIPAAVDTTVAVKPVEEVVKK